MGYNHFRYARRIDDNNLGIYHDDLTKLLNFDKSTPNDIVARGGLGVTGDYFEMHANMIDTYPKLIFAGNDYFQLCHAPGSFVATRDGLTTVFKLHYPSNVPTIEAVPANSDLQLIPTGTGKVRFGVHSATGDVVSNGHITIRDQAGGTIKLMTKA